MPNLSRRHLVTTAAALPALAMPAIAGPNGPNRDAELLRLCVELDATIIEWHRQRAIDRNLHVVREAVCEAAGLPDIDFGSVPDDEYRAYIEKRIIGPSWKPRARSLALCRCHSMTRRCSHEQISIQAIDSRA